MGPIEHRHGEVEGVVALTFDDGPSLWTEPMLDLLAEHDGHAAFFAIGCVVAAGDRNATLQRIVESGSEVGNHTFTHPSLPTIDEAAIHDEFERAGTVIEETLGTKLLYWRPPYFHVDERVREAVAPFGLREVGCAMMPWDWEWPAAQTAEFVLERIQPGSVVCMHDGRPPEEPAELSAPTREESVAALATILATLTERGLRSVTISELLAAD